MTNPVGFSRRIDLPGNSPVTKVSPLNAGCAINCDCRRSDRIFNAPTRPPLFNPWVIGFLGLREYMPNEDWCLSPVVLWARPVGLSWQSQEHGFSSRYIVPHLIHSCCSFEFLLEYSSKLYIGHFANTAFLQLSNHHRHVPRNQDSYISPLRPTPTAIDSQRIAYPSTYVVRGKPPSWPSRNSLIPPVLGTILRLG